MPIRSQAQRAFLHIHHPGIAKRWERETSKGKLPKHVRDARDTSEIDPKEVEMGESFSLTDFFP